MPLRSAAGGHGAFGGCQTVQKSSVQGEDGTHERYASIQACILMASKIRWRLERQGRVRPCVRRSRSKRGSLISAIRACRKPRTRANVAGDHAVRSLQPATRGLAWGVVRPRSALQGRGVRSLPAWPNLGLWWLDTALETKRRPGAARQKPPSCPFRQLLHASTTTTLTNIHGYSMVR